MKARQDKTALIRAIRERSVLSSFIGETMDLRRKGPEFEGLCPFHREKTPSFTVSDAKQFYHCFGCGANGDIITYAQKRFSMNFLEAVEYLAGRLGLADIAPGRPAPVPLPTVSDGARVAADTGLTDEWVASVWRRATKDVPTVAFYLAGRGIDPAKIGGIPPTLRYSKLLHKQHPKDDGLTLPCMVSAIQAVDKRVVGIHRTFLEIVPAADYPHVREVTERVLGRRVERVVLKTRRESAKKMGGTAKGCAVRLCAAAETLAIAEGIETALSIRQATGMACWAALSLGNMETVELPPEVKTVVLCADNDMKDERLGLELIRKAEIAHLSGGRRVRVAWPPPGLDFNDLLFGRVSDVGEKVLCT